MTATEGSGGTARPLLWGGLWLGAMLAIGAMRLSGAFEEPVGFVLMALSMGLLIPFVRAMNRRSAARGCISPALIRYNRGIVLASFGYVLGLGVAVGVFDRWGAQGATGFLLAMLPVIPILFMIYVMGRYLAEESDEYLRHRAIIAALAGLGLLLGLGSFWGFLETFGMVPHVPGWAAVPLWAIGLGIAQCWLALRDRAPPEDAATPAGNTDR